MSEPTELAPEIEIAQDLRLGLTLPELPETIRLHDLWHAAITNAISQGEDILIVAAFAGHAKTSTTVDVYSHLLPKRTHEAARRMRSVAPLAA